MSRMTVRAAVDLPQPDSPTRPSVSPRRRSKLMPSTALTSPTWRRNTTPWRSGKYFLRSRTSRMFSVFASGIEGDLLVVVAATDPARADVVRRRVLGETVVATERTARVERTAAGDVGQVR